MLESTTTTSSTTKLMEDLKVVIADAEELLRMTADQMGDKAVDLRLRMQTRLDHAKGDLARLQEAALVRAKEAGQAAEAYVHDHPWRAVGIAAGVGLVIGLLISRR